MDTCAQSSLRKNPPIPIRYHSSEILKTYLDEFTQLIQANWLAETNNIDKYLLASNRKRMARRKPKSPKPVIAPIVVPPDFERDTNDARTRVNYMMQVRLELGMSAFFDTYHHAQRYPDWDTIIALQRLRKKFPDLVLGQDEKKFWKKMIGREPQ